MNKISTVKYLLSVIIYGTIGFFLHFINAKSEFVVLCRGLLGSLFIYIVCLLKKEKLNISSIKANFKYLLLSGMSLGFNWIFLFAGYRYGVAITSLFNYLAPILIIICCAFMFNEKPNGKQILSIIIAVIGITLVSGVFDEKGSIDIHCIVYGMLACLGFVGLILCNKKLKDINSFDKSVVQLFISALTVLPYVLINRAIPNEIDTLSIVLIIVLGFIHTGLAYIFYFSTITVLPVQTVAILGYIEPVLSILIGALVFKEYMSVYSIVGAILIIGACILNEIFS